MSGVRFSVSDRHVDRLVNDFRRAPRQVRAQVRKQARAAGKIIGQHAKQQLRKRGRSGAVYRNGPARGRRASTASEYPAKVTGNLAKSIKWRPQVNRRYVNTEVYTAGRHAHLLEYGTEKRYRAGGGYTGRVAPRPMLRASLREKAPEASRVLLGGVEDALRQTF